MVRGIPAGDGKTVNLFYSVERREIYSCKVLLGTNMWRPTVPELLTRGIIVQGTLIHGTTAGDDYSVVKHRGSVRAS